MAVTQKEIARKLGVSRQAVGFALHGGGRLAPSTRELIRQTAEELGYNPDASRNARALITGYHGRRLKSGIIALILPALFEDKPIRGEPFFRSLLHGIHSEALRRQLEVSVCFSHPGQKRPPRLIGASVADGVICLESSDIVAHARAQNLPVVVLDEMHPDAHSILPANKKGASLATQYLIDLGHRDIAFLSSPLDNPAVRGRYEGYVEALRIKGLKLSNNLIHCHLSNLEPEVIAAGAEQLLNSSSEFTAVVCHNDLIAMGLVTRFQELGRKVPQEVSVVGFDDISPDYFFSPEITSVAFDRKGMGRRAVELLCAESDGEISVMHHEQMPVELVIRQSTAPPPAV